MLPPPNSSHLHTHLLSSLSTMAAPASALIGPNSAGLFSHLRRASSGDADEDADEEDGGTPAALSVAAAGGVAWGQLKCFKELRNTSTASVIRSVIGSMLVLAGSCTDPRLDCPFSDAKDVWARRLLSILSIVLRRLPFRLEPLPRDPPTPGDLTRPPCPCTLAPWSGLCRWSSSSCSLK